MSTTDTTDYPRSIKITKSGDTYKFTPLTEEAKDFCKTWCGMKTSYFERNKTAAPSMAHFLAEHGFELVF